MRAILNHPNAIPQLTMHESAKPIPARDQALVRVSAFSLNAGETRTALEATTSYNPGSDFAGIVEAAAADGTSPHAGAKVFGFVLRGAWSEYVAVAAGQIAEIPSNMSFSQAAALPVAGVTAMLSLEKAGSLLGRRVLITGAAGGVGRFACQLAAIGGAKVFAVSRRNDLRERLGEDHLSPAAVFPTMAEAKAAGCYDVIFDSVGGDTLSLALTALARRGICINCGNSTRQQTSFDALEFYRGTGGGRLQGVWLGTEPLENLKAALVRLADMVAEGHLRVPIDAVLPWTDMNMAADRLMNQAVNGKIVMHIT